MNQNNVDQPIIYQQQHVNDPSPMFICLTDLKIQHILQKSLAFD